MPPKWKRVVLSVEDKVENVSKLKKDDTGSKLAPEYAVGTSTISDIKKSSEPI